MARYCAIPCSAPREITVVLRTLGAGRLAELMFPPSRRDWRQVGRARLHVVSYQPLRPATFNVGRILLSYSITTMTGTTANRNCIGPGYGLNMGNPRAWLLIAGMMLVPMIAARLLF
jgi:hypothetical protein